MVELKIMYLSLDELNKLIQNLIYEGDDNDGPVYMGHVFGTDTFSTTLDKDADMLMSFYKNNRIIKLSENNIRAYLYHFDVENKKLWTKSIDIDIASYGTFNLHTLYHYKLPIIFTCADLLQPKEIVDVVDKYIKAYNDQIETFYLLNTHILEKVQESVKIISECEVEHWDQKNE